MPRLTPMIALAAAAMLAAGPAAAQKANSTMRSSSFFPTRTLDAYFDPNPTTDELTEAVFDTLIVQDLKTGELKPLLAKSWTRVSPTVLEFELRDDVKWHDGQKFTADDVVSTINWLIDPSTTIVSKPNWSFIEKIEKVGDYKVRITNKGPTAYDLMRFAYFTPIYPAHVHGKMPDKTQFGLKPVGTGPYKAATVDLNQGFILERNEDYKTWASPAKPQNNFRRYITRSAPDVGVQIARFLVGETDHLQVVGLDQLQQVQAQRPKAQFVVARNLGYNMFSIPTHGAKLNPPLGDVRVRRAMMMAIDRSAIEKLRSGETSPPVKLCFEGDPGCAQSAVPYPYDPAGAKKLLAEAGYPNGFDLELTCTSSSGTRTAAELAASFLQAVGIRVKLDVLPLPAVRSKILEKKAQATVNAENAGIMPDSSSEVLPYYMGQYFDDPKTLDLARRSVVTIDEAARKKITGELFDIGITDAYQVPLQWFTRWQIFNEDVVLTTGKTTPYGNGYAFRDLNFK